MAITDGFRMMPVPNGFKSKPIVYSCGVSVGIALLVVGVGAMRGAKAQSTDTATRSATSDGRPLQIDRGAVGLWQSLLKLHTRASLLMVVAHPDDEDGGMLTLESRGQGARAMMLTLNRGEGGQNVMSDDFEDALGLVRTQELLSADRYSGVQQFFSSVVDFGFSKTREESLSSVGPRPCPCRRGSRRPHNPAFGGHLRFRGWPDGWPRASSSGWTDRTGSFCGCRRPEHVPGTNSRRAAALVASKNVCPGSHSFDHADREFATRLPANISRCVSTTIFTKIGRTGCLRSMWRFRKGILTPSWARPILQIAREGLALQKSQNGGGGIPYRRPCEHSLPSLWLAGSGERQRRVLSSMGSMSRWQESRIWRRASQMHF